MWHQPSKFFFTSALLHCSCRCLSRTGRAPAHCPAPGLPRFHLTILVTLKILTNKARVNCARNVYNPFGDVNQAHSFQSSRQLTLVSILQQRRNSGLNGPVTEMSRSQSMLPLDSCRGLPHALWFEASPLIPRIHRFTFCHIVRERDFYFQELHAL